MELSEDAPVQADLVGRLVSELSLLQNLRRGLPAYYQALAQSSDPLLCVAAWVALLDLKAVWSHQAELVVAHSRYGAVKRRAFPFFLSVYAYDFAQRVADQPSEDVDDLLTRRMKAELALDYQQMSELDVALYMAHGAPEYLWNAEGNAEQAAGWRASVPLYTKTLLARPMDHNGPFQLLLALRNANQPSSVEKVCAAFERAELYKAETTTFRAALLNDAGDAKGSLKVLERAPMKFTNPVLGAFASQVKGEALAGTGAFRESYAAYQRMNSINRPTNIDPKAFYRALEKRVGYKFESPQEDRRGGNHVLLVGFPRSGTTLLENALAAHPKVETFEESVALGRMSRWLERFASPNGEVPDKVALEARDAYFDEFRRRSTKPEAAVNIDKMPMSSAEAVFLKNILPDVRFIFSIRHPYDVIISCFKQDFIPNPAMENFRTIADAAALYDFTMSQWFSVHSLNDDPSVCYVRYEDLVQRFRPTLERVLDFIGVGWDDAVLDFVAAADKRFAKTPSYKKVRSGLSIGVQSSRENYKFLFETKETAVLKKWVKHFGYDD